MTNSTDRVERRGGRRDGPPRIAKCGHAVTYHPGPLKKQCSSCAHVDANVCKQCGRLVERRIDAVFCGVFCRETFSGNRMIGPRNWRLCALPECDVKFEPAKSSVRCCSERHGKILYNRLSRASGLQTNPWNDRRRDNWHARRARQGGAPVKAAAFLSDIVARDGLCCGLCGELVDMSLLWPDRMSHSIDHVVPISRGGVHAISNCQLAHLSCNSRKGNRVA